MYQTLVSLALKSDVYTSLSVLRQWVMEALPVLLSVIKNSSTYVCVIVFIWSKI